MKIEPADPPQHLDAHEAELEEPRNDVGIEVRLLVHLGDVRTDLGLGEVTHRIAEHRLFFRKRRERLRRGADVLHGNSGGEGDWLG